MNDTVMQLLREEKKRASARLEQIRNEAAQLTEYLAHLAISERTVTKVMAVVPDKPAPARHDAQPAEQTAIDSGGAGEKQPDVEGVGVAAAPMPNQRAASAPTDGSPLGPVSARIRLLVCGTARPLTAKHITLALGRDASKRTNVESVRAALEKLVSNGHLAKVGPGLFAAPHERSGGTVP
ncbi:hypothetical protein NX801_27580 [Streptomyces sp. LP05-1]|uniref:Uncharacterized protein n=1 Tax=Streptomyces pyxinae TaxID=2970734 RepID=A0ABT2CPG4_9ACTN|nr:hypothetical protein [Streptomyces sp. LP05-1]MCS0639333.1 hypothetical protein [Streptomyces sp. LP05-1]